MVTWNEFLGRVEDKVNTIAEKQEVFEGSLDFSKIAGEVFKEIIMEEGGLKRKVVGRDIKRGEPGRLVLYKDDSARKIRSVKG